MGFEAQTSFFDTGHLNEPKLEPSDLEALPAELEYAGIAHAIIEGATITITEGGVVSCFEIDLENATASLDEEHSKEFDLFGADNGTHQVERPLHSAAQVHERRLNQVNKALQALANPQLIE